MSNYQTNVTAEEVLETFKGLYPDQFARVVAEVRAAKAEKHIRDLENGDTEPEPEG